MITVMHTVYASNIFCPHCGEYYSNKELVKNGYLDSANIISKVDCKGCRKEFDVMNKSKLIVNFRVITKD